MIEMIRIYSTFLSLGLLLLYAGDSPAVGILVDKIYHPYVHPSEQEIEWRMIFQDEQSFVADDTWQHQLAYGRSLNERWFGEVYLIGKKSDAGGFDIEAYEVEALWQLTEQGEFSADWGMLFELEREASEDKWKLATGLLVEKEWRKWSGAANFFISGVWGSDVKNELQTRLGLQARYRYSRSFEPAIEFYNSEGARGIGPVLLGQTRIANSRKLNWEAGVIFGLNSKSPDHTLRLLIEFEF